MSTQDPTRRQGAQPGWYWADDGQRRYWDGQSWSRQVAPPNMEPPPKPPTPRRRVRLGRQGRGIVVIGIFLVAIALVRGQGLKSFDFATGKAEFYSPAASHNLSAKTIKSSQPAIEDRLHGLQGQAAQEQSTNPTTSSQNLSGSWTGDTGLKYVIQQYGSNAVIQESSPYGVTAVGSGAVQDGRFTFQFESVDGATGTGQLSLVDSDTLQGNFASDGATVPADLHR